VVVVDMMKMAKDGSLLKMMGYYHLNPDASMAA